MNDIGNLVILLLGGVFFQCYLHSTQSNDDEYEEKKEDSKIKENISHNLTKIKKDKKKPGDY